MIIAERAHHPFSPSTLQPREACPKYQPRDGTNVAAERGTLQHRVTETREDINELTDEEASAAAECLDFYEQRRQHWENERMADVDHLRAELAGEDNPPDANKEVPPVIELNETYLPVDGQPITYRVNPGVHHLTALAFAASVIKSGEPWTDTCEKLIGGALGGIGHNPTTTAGYIDKAIISHDRLYAELFDWKFGKWAVENAENNLQGIAYYLGLLFKFPTLKLVRVWFKMPHIDGIDHHDFLASDRDKHLLRVRTVVARSIQAAETPEDFSSANPTVSGCLFCGLIGKCPKVAEVALQIGKKFAPLKIPAEINPSLLRDRSSASVAMKCAAVIAVWCASLKTTTSNAVISGSMDMPEGYTITSRSDRVITDAKKFREIALTYLSEEEYNALREELPPITKVEKVISDKAPRGDKTSTLKDFNQRLTDAKALDREPPYSFLRMSNSKDDKQQTKPN